MYFFILADYKNSQLTLPCTIELTKNSFAKGKVLSFNGLLEVLFSTFFPLALKLILHQHYDFPQTKFTTEQVRRKNPVG
jgi:hypothetical protein